MKTWLYLFTVLLVLITYTVQAGTISFQQFDNDARDGLDTISAPAVLAVGQAVEKTFSGQRIITDLDGNKRVDAR